MSNLRGSIMIEEFYVDTKRGTMMVSNDLVNEISGYLVAQTDTKEELDSLLRDKAKEQYARKEALKRAYEEVPIPAGSLSMEVRRELQQRRNNLVEKYYKEYLENY